MSSVLTMPVSSVSKIINKLVYAGSIIKVLVDTVSVTVSHIAEYI